MEERFLVDKPHQLAARESPMGQSSSTPAQTPGSSSHRSSYSVGHVTFSTFKPENDNDGSEDEMELKMLGPASKYPEPSGSRPSSTRLTPQTLKSESQGARDLVVVNGNRTRSESSTPAPPTTRDVPPRSNARPPSRLSGPLGVGLSSRSPGGPVVNDAFVSDTGDERVYGGSTDRLHADDSIFDLHDQARLGAPSESSSNRSVTPPLPPLSPTSSQPESTSSAIPQPALNRFFVFGPPSRPGGQAQKGTEVPSVARTPDLLVTSSTPGGTLNGGRSVTEGRPATTGQQTSRVTGSAGLRVPPAHGPVRKVSVPARDDVDGSRQFARSQSLDDVRETCSDSNNLSFDVDNTFLMVEPSELSDTDTMVSRDTRSLRGQLQKLEGMYHDVLRIVGGEQGALTRSGRRWSIASSDTSSFKKGRHLRAPSSTFHRPGVSRDLKSVNKRFQKLESHVVTLARSIAHVSSELRAHNSLCRDLDLVKRELRELKQKGPAAPAESPRDLVTPFDKFRGWIPSLTNPKRINKLTQFFGQEPPLLEIFLKKLGYERYVKNFEAEHIGMIELPYMTEERLQSLGIPMGPRLRILQESQLCFRQENFDIYIV
ncbi:uncharacterized protein LOC112570951 [Pomacea canaliculata]|nr:uncharacterized protein LOC112570951 [Pomacea canaliculata]